MKKALSLGLVLVAAAGFAAPVSNVVESAAVGALTLLCPEPGAWRLSLERVTATEPETEEYRVSLTNAAAAEPPKFTVSFSLPQHDIHFVWHTGAESPVLPPKWHQGFVANLASGMPLVELLGCDDRNRLAFGTSESVLPVRCRAGLKEEDCTVPCSLTFFELPSAAVAGYSVRVRFDRRSRRWDDTVRDFTVWMERAGGYAPMKVPEAARDPLYSTWYAFTQDVSASAIEDEAKRAAALGMKTLILDDGWQTDETGRAYERCGDMIVSTNKFPAGMAAHVEAVHAAGLKYMVWVAVPFVGYKSPAFPRFKGKYLKDLHDVHCSVLDPRFPEVRAYLVDLFSKMQREWVVDGFKFDYVGQIDLRGAEDPAVKENFAGRDCRSVADAVDLLMTAILRKLKAYNPNVLIEYREPYVSPGIRRYGNMVRAIDCPGEMQKNIVRTAMLRLTSGETAVHSDMLEWNASDTPECAAKPILASLFSTIQYSVVLSRQSDAVLKMMKHWIAFTQKHREALLKGKLTARHPEANFPLLESETSDERVMVVYNDLLVASVRDAKPTVVVNATGSEGLLVQLAEPMRATVCDTFGRRVGGRLVKAGVTRLAVPVSGFVELRR